MPGDLLELARSKLPFTHANGHASDGHVASPPFGSKLISRITWSEQPTPLKDFADTHDVPNVIKVTKGQYRNVGASKSVHNTLYLHTVTTSKKVVVESVKIKEGKKAVVLDNKKYAIPLTYKGWFEVLSEDGKAIRPLITVNELALSSSKGHASKYLVREATRAYLLGPTGDVELQETHVVPAGDVLEIFGEDTLKFREIPGKKRFLRVSATTTDQQLYLPLQMRGSFSPIAGQHNISGVHSALSLLEKFRLPIMVKLVHGLIPTKLQKHFTGAFRLIHVFTDETAFVCPFKREARMIPISTREPLKVVSADNLDDLKNESDLQILEERCTEMHASFMNSIHVLFSLPEPADLSQNRRKLVSNKDSNPSVIPQDEEDVLFKEVEDIYHYVREGGPEPAPRPRPPATVSQAVTAAPPSPPPAIQVVKFTGSDTTPKVYSKLPEKKRFSFKALWKKGRGKENPGKSEYVNTPQAAAEEKDLPFEPPPDFAMLDFDAEEELEDSAANPGIPAEDYWEEPIYAPLHKFQKAKIDKKEKETVIKLGKGGHKPMLVADPEENYRNEVLPPNVSKDAQIQNLRQIYKKKTIASVNSSASGEHSGSSPPMERSRRGSGRGLIRQMYEDDLDDLQDVLSPPPVPPKNLDPEDLQPSIQPPMKSWIRRNSFSEQLLAAHSSKHPEFDDKSGLYANTRFHKQASVNDDSSKERKKKAYKIKMFSETSRPLSKSHGEDLHMAHETRISQNRQRHSAYVKTISVSKPVAIMYSANGTAISLVENPAGAPDGHSHAPYIAVAKVDANAQAENFYENLHPKQQQKMRFKKLSDKSKNNSRVKLKNMYL